MVDLCDPLCPRGAPGWLNPPNSWCEQGAVGDCSVLTAEANPTPSTPLLQAFKFNIFHFFHSSVETS